MRHTTAFLVLLGCLSGTAVAEIQHTLPANTELSEVYASGDNQPCSVPVREPDPDAPQNQIEYGG